MSTDITVGKRVMVMRSGLPHFINEDTAKKIEDLLKEATTNRFIEVSELGVTISTSQVEGIYSMDTYDDLVKIKQGQFKCPWRVWHMKRGECDCRAEFNKKERIRRQKAEQEEALRPLSAEEQKKRERAAKKIGDEIRALGLAKRVRPTLKRSKLDAYQKKHGTPYAIPDGYDIEEDITKKSS